MIGHHVQAHQKVVKVLVQERLEIELIWKDVVQLPQSSDYGAALVAPGAKMTVQQRVVYGSLDLVNK